MSEERQLPSGEAFGFPAAEIEDAFDDEGPGHVDDSFFEPWDAPGAEEQQPAEALPVPTDIQTPAPAAAETPSPEASQPAPAQEGAPDGAQPAAPETPAAETTDTPQVYAGRFSSVEELEKGYSNVWNMHLRTAEQNRSLQAERDQMEAALAQVVPLIQRLQQSGQLAEALGMDEDTLRQMQSQQATEARLAAMQQQVVAAQESSAAQAAITAFRTRHPEVVPGPIEQAMLEVFAEHDLEPTDPAVYEIALEAAKDPQLRKVLRANPALIDTDEGMEIARQLAAMPTLAQAQSVGAQQASQQARAQQQEARARQAHVETGPAGGPPMDAQTPPRDPFDQVMDLAKRSRSGSAFFS